MAQHKQHTQNGVQLRAWEPWDDMTDEGFRGGSSWRHVGRDPSRRGDDGMRPTVSAEGRASLDNGKESNPTRPCGHENSMPMHKT